MGRWVDQAEQFDLAVYAAIAERPTPILDWAMRNVSKAADYSKLSIAAAAALGVTGGATGRRAAAMGLASLGATATVVNLVMKPLGRRRRPDRSARVPEARQVCMPLSSSFPSGHTAAAFAFATGVGHVSPAAGMPLQALAALVGYSRIHTGVHFPGDVVFGALAGVALAEVTAQALDRRLDCLR